MPQNEPPVAAVDWSDKTTYWVKASSGDASVNGSGYIICIAPTPGQGDASLNYLSVDGGNTISNQKLLDTTEGNATSLSLVQRFDSSFVMNEGSGGELIAVYVLD